jgi:AMMECR1 domain-containing protein
MGRVLLIFPFIFFFSVSLYARDVNLDGFRRLRSDPVLKPKLEEIVRTAVRNAFGEETTPFRDLDPFFQDPFPVFVTVKRGEEVRGCMGSLVPRKSSLAEEIVSNLKLAFSKDPRHRPVLREEVGPGMEIFITTAGHPVPVDRFEEISPARDGVLVRQGGKEAVVLPGEAKTRRYLKAFALTKAGIKRGEPFQVFRLETATASVGIDGNILSPRPKEEGRPESNPRGSGSTPSARP